ncbi:transposase [Pseudanabaena sp. UWO310]|nr:transposase [Pseudanabaena sp. UWO310]
MLWLSDSYRFFFVRTSFILYSFSLLPSVFPISPVVERTFAWFSRFRRLTREYELLPETSEAFFYVGMIHILLKRLA